MQNGALPSLAPTFDPVAKDDIVNKAEAGSVNISGTAAPNATLQVVTAETAAGESRPAARRAAQPTGRLPRWYPGSPWLALQLMRPQDRLRCFEAHPTEIQVLRKEPVSRQ